MWETWPFLASNQLHDLFTGQPWVLRKAVNHIETFSILESIQRMVGAADHSNANAPASDLQWLPQTTVLQHLLSKYGCFALSLL